VTDEQAHARTIVVWDVPAAVVRGESFSFKAGIKCMAQCRPDEWLLEVRDHEGESLAIESVANEPWPGTAALYPVEFELTAPADEGVFGWQIVAATRGSEVASSDGEAVRHAQALASFNIRTVPESECCLTVIAIDRAAGTPVPGLKVVAHPYRAMTDDRGIAELYLPKGHYRLFVSGKDFFPLRLDGELTADQTIQARLELDTGPSDAEIWS
jgi:hypothetical protein